MSEFYLSPEAKTAPVDIFDYTRRTLGEKQADIYLDGLFDTYGRIADRTVLWRPIPSEYGVAGWFARYERHLVYWKTLNGGEIGIVTVLHSAMLQGQRLRDAFGPDQA